MTKPKSLDWPDCLNVRDLGGLPTVDGGRIATAALIRSDNLTRLTAVGIRSVRESGISRIVDVRSAAECEDYLSPFADDPLHCNRPLAQPDDTFDPIQSLERDYFAMLDRNPDLFAAAIEAIATAPPGGVLVHCHAGKDRSGNVVALALSLAGVPAEVIADDYAAVSDQMRHHFDELLGAVEDSAGRDRLAEEFSSRPETMIAVLDHLDAEYDGAEGYLRSGGLGSVAIDHLRARLVDPAP